MNVRRPRSLTLLLVTILVMAAAASCVTPFSEIVPASGGESRMTMQIVVPSTDLFTKGSPISASEAENQLYDVRVWAFAHDNNAPDGDMAVGYGSAILSDGATSSEVTISFPNGVNGKLDDAASVSVDVYVVANGPSAGFDRSGIQVSRHDLRVAVMDDSKGAGFGTACVSQVPEKGLPMSVYRSDVDVTFLKFGLTADQVAYIKAHPSMPESNPVDHLGKEMFTASQWQGLASNGNWSKVHPSITLKRAVAKIRFVFAKNQDMTAETEITNISLVGTTTGTALGNMLPASTNLFPRENGKFSLPGTPSYDPVSWGSDGNALVTDVQFEDARIDNPIRLRKDSRITTESHKAPASMDIAEYERFLSDEIEANNALERVLYLRESNATNIKARITYKIGGETKPPVDIDIPDVTDKDAPAFQRNRWWTVYAYFSDLQQQLVVLQMTVLDWEGKNIETVTSSETVNVDQDGKFFVDPSFLGYFHMDTVYVVSKGRLKSSRFEVHVPKTTETPDYARGRVVIYGPSGGYLQVQKHGETADPSSDESAFNVTLESTDKTGTVPVTYNNGIINPDYDGGRIFIKVSRTSDSDALVGRKISLSFLIRLSDGRIIDPHTDASNNSEIIDETFYFVIKNDPGSRGLYQDDIWYKIREEADGSFSLSFDGVWYGIEVGANDVLLLHKDDRCYRIENGHLVEVVDP